MFVCFLGTLQSSSNSPYPGRVLRLCSAISKTEMQVPELREEVQKLVSSSLLPISPPNITSL